MASLSRISPTYLVFAMVLLNPGLAVEVHGACGTSHPANTIRSFFYMPRLRKASRRRKVLPCRASPVRSEEHTSELQSLMRISYAVFCLKKTKQPTDLIT